MSRIGWPVKRALTRRLRLRYSCSFRGNGHYRSRYCRDGVPLRRDSRLIIHSRTNSTRMIVHGSSTTSFVYFFTFSQTRIVPHIVASLCLARRANHRPRATLNILIRERTARTKDTWITRAFAFAE
jgi:hypothetical protein